MCAACCIVLRMARRTPPEIEIDTLTLRRIAVDAICDPRTVRARLLGKQVRGLVGERIEAALRQHGIDPSAGGEHVAG
jgi:hypothetical protein